MVETPDVSVISDNAVLVTYAECIDESVNAQVMDLCKKLAHLQSSDQALEGVIEWVPSYHSLQILYDSLVCNPHTLVAEVKELINNQTKAQEHKRRVVSIPVCYESPYGPDIDLVCKHHNISRAELIEKHTGRQYLIYMMGFTPGFPYLGGMDESIAMKRKEKPRLKIPAGSVGIAGAQTGIYPVESPGGWQIIGRTPYVLFDPQAHDPFLLEAGDYIEFYPISVERFQRMQASIGKDKQ